MDTITHSLDIIKTKDGSCTLHNKEMDETYHSVNGAMTESLHVFIRNGLFNFKNPKSDIHILEVGLGTGLNALMTLDNIPKGKTIFYTAIEPFPITLEMAELYFSEFETKPKHLDLLQKLFSVRNNGFLKINDWFYFRFTTSPLQLFSEQELLNAYSKICPSFSGFDVIYYDAFAPQKQPDMWELNVLKIAADLLAVNGLLTSYCAQGQFRRHLKSLNLQIESMSGPPGKREMTNARKQKEVTFL